RTLLYDKGGDEVVVLLAALVIEQRAPLPRLTDGRRGDRPAGGALGGQLEHAERRARVGGGQARDVRERGPGAAPAGRPEGGRAASRMVPAGIVPPPASWRASSSTWSAARAPPLARRAMCASASSATLTPPAPRPRSRSASGRRRISITSGSPGGRSTYTRQ